MKPPSPAQEELHRPSPVNKKKQEEAERLAKALRANLKRRKSSQGANNDKN